MTSLKAQALPVARHECGHFVAASELGFKVEPPRIRVNSDGGFRGESEIQLQMPVGSMPEVDKYLRGRAVVLVAGAMAEAIEHGLVKRGHAVKIFEGATAQQDFAKYREALYLLRNIRHGVATEKELHDQLSTINDSLWDEAMTLVSKERSYITNLAKVLAAKVNLAGAVYDLTVDEILACSK